MSLLCRVGLHERYKSVLYWRCQHCPGAWVKRTHSRGFFSCWRRFS